MIVFRYKIELTEDELLQAMKSVHRERYLKRKKETLE